MARLLRIEDCSECKNVRYDFNEVDAPGWYECEVAGREHWHEEVGDGIPDWCPLPEASGWIPVGERRPTERGTYEIAMPPLSQNEQYPYILVCEWAPAYGFHSEVCGTTFVYDADVIAWRRWQPLPALPKEATDADRR